MKHTDELTLQRLADGELSPERVHSARSHLLECARCQSTHESLKAETELIRSALRGADETIPDAIAPRADTSWVLIAVIVAAVLALSAFWGQMPSTETSDAESTSLVTRLLIRGVLFRGWSTIVSFFFTLITVVVVIVAAVGSARWAFRRMRSSQAAILAGLGLLSLAAPDLEAAVVAMDETEYRLGADERVDNDLLVVAEQVVIEGDVGGDLIVLADTLEVSGTIVGDIIGFADSIELTGTVEGNLRTASRSLELEGRVLRNVLAASVRTRLAPRANVVGSFTGASTDRIEIESPVGRDVTAAARFQTLDGSVGGSARLSGRELTIGPRTEVAGETRFRGREEPTVHAEARLASPLEFERVQRDWKLDLRVPPVTRFVFLWAAAFLFGAPLLLLGPDVAAAVTTVHLPARGKSLLVGLLGLLTLGSLALIAMVTLIGVPLAVLLLATLGLGLYAAQTYVGAYIGSEILGQPVSPGERLGQLALGLLLIHAAAAIPVVGAIVSALVALLGFGGLVSWAMDHMTPPSVSAAAAPPVPSAPSLPS